MVLIRNKVSSSYWKKKKKKHITIFKGKYQIINTVKPAKTESLEIEKEKIKIKLFN